MSTREVRDAINRGARPVLSSIVSNTRARTKARASVLRRPSMHNRERPLIGRDASQQSFDRCRACSGLKGRQPHGRVPSSKKESPMPNFGIGRRGGMVATKSIDNSSTDARLQKPLIRIRSTRNRFEDFLTAPSANHNRRPIRGCCGVRFEHWHGGRVASRERVRGAALQQKQAAKRTKRRRAARRRPRWARPS